MTLVHIRSAAPVTTLSNATPGMPVPETTCPVVNVLRCGRNRLPAMSLTPSVTSNRYVVAAASVSVGVSTSTSPPPLVFTDAGTTLPSDAWSSRTVSSVTVAGFTAPPGR